MADQKPVTSADAEAIGLFVDEMIKAKNSPYVNDKNRGEIKSQLMADISDSINRKLVASLVPEKVEELNGLLDREASDDEIGGFFQKNVEDMPGKISEVLLDFRAGYLSVVYPPDSTDSKLIPTDSTVSTGSTNLTNNLSDDGDGILPAPLAPNVVPSTRGEVGLHPAKSEEKLPDTVVAPMPQNLVQQDGMGSAQNKSTVAAMADSKLIEKAVDADKNEAGDAAKLRKIISDLALVGDKNKKTN